MSQMYRVSFTTHWQDRIERGESLVCADNQEAARDMVITHKRLASSCTQTEIARVKPSIYDISHTETPIGEKKASARNLGEYSGKPSVQHRIQVSCVLNATGEDHALRKLAGKLNDRGNERRTTGKQDDKGMFVEVTPLIPGHGDVKGMEAVETYQPKHFIGGVRGGNK